MSKEVAKKRYISPSIATHSEISLCEFSDDEIDAEFAHRHGHENDVPTDLVEAVVDEPLKISGSRLRELRTLIQLGRNAEAIRATSDFICDTLGTAI